MVEALRLSRGGFIRPFGSPSIDPDVGAPQADIFHHYKTALIRVVAEDRAVREERPRLVLWMSMTHEGRVVKDGNGLYRLATAGGGDDGGGQGYSLAAGGGHGGGGGGARTGANANGVTKADNLGSPPTVEEERPRRNR